MLVGMLVCVYAVLCMLCCAVLLEHKEYREGVAKTG
jgi:hypothetical protein